MACSSSAVVTTSSDGETMGGGGKSGDAGNDLVFGVVVHLVSEAPAPPSALAGLSAEVSDANVSPSALDMSMHWPAQARPLSPTGAGAVADVLHGCTGPDPISISVRSCAVGATTPPGCLSMRVDSIGVVGNFVHPNGPSCDVRGGQGEIFLRSTAGQTSTAPSFTDSDVIKGQLRAPCWQGDTVWLWIDATFELNVSRSFLAC
jgi:hypothetical protein